MVGRTTFGVVLAAGVAVTVALSGCSVGSGARIALGLAGQPEYVAAPRGGSTPSDELDLAVGATDWETLATCDDTVAPASPVPWSRVAGYPEAALDAVGIVADCGYTGGDQSIGYEYVGVLASVTDGTIYSLGGQLTMSGWFLESDDFAPDLDAPDGEYAGTRQYSDEYGDFFVIEAYDNGTIPATFTTYFDFSTAAGDPS